MLTYLPGAGIGIEEEIAGQYLPKQMMILGRRILPATNVERRGILPRSANPKGSQIKCMPTCKKKIQMKMKTRTFLCSTRPRG
jgi:hypothetical protein